MSADSPQPAPASQPQGDASVPPESLEAGAGTPTTEEDEASARRAAKLAQIQDRMARHADFPSLKESIRGIQKVSRSEHAHLRALTDEVLQDVALTNKLLRLINTAYYSSVGGGQITTMSRAVALMGFTSVGMMAASLALFDRLPKGADGARVREEFACALMAALIANDLAPARKIQESAYITALFQNLGSMLAWLHLPEEAREVEGRLLELHPQTLEEAFVPNVMLRATPEEIERLSREVMGLGLQELGIEIAQQWGWPPEVVQALRPLPPPGEEETFAPHDRVRGVCTAANQLARSLFGCTMEQRPERLASFHTTWGHAIGLSPEELDAVVERTMGEWAELAPVMNLPRPELVSAMTGTPANGKPATGKPAPRPGTPARAPAAPASRPNASVHRPPTPKPPPPAPRADDPKRIAHLTAGIEQLSLAAMSDVSIAELMQSFIRLLGQALAAERALICLRARNPERLEGRLGWGGDAPALASVFNVPLAPPTDLFGLLCTKGADTLITDTSDPLIAQRLPPWFSQRVRAPAFLLLPMMRAGLCVGMVYVDARRPLHLTDRELTMVKGLRNQVLMALQLRETASNSPPARMPDSSR